MLALLPLALATDAAHLAAIAEDGLVVLVDKAADGSLKSVKAAAVVDAPRDRVWALVTDFDAYEQWAPQMVDATVVSRTDTQVDVAFDLAFRFSVVSKHVKYTMRHTLDAPSTVRFDLVEGDMSGARGGWELHDLGGRTLVVYENITDLSSMGWIVGALLEEQPAMELAIQSSTVATMVEAVEKAL